MWQILSSLLLIELGAQSADEIWSSWRFSEFARASLVPSAVYLVQNVLINVAYRHLHPVTFAMLTQTKLLFTALFNFLVLR